MLHLLLQVPQALPVSSTRDFAISSCIWSSLSQLLMTSSNSQVFNLGQGRQSIDPLEVIPGYQTIQHFICYTRLSIRSPNARPGSAIIVSSKSVKLKKLTLPMVCLFYYKKDRLLPMSFKKKTLQFIQMKSTVCLKGTWHSKTRRLEPYTPRNHTLYKQAPNYPLQRQLTLLECSCLNQNIVVHTKKHAYQQIEYTTLVRE